MKQFLHVYRVLSRLLYHPASSKARPAGGGIARQAPPADVMTLVEVHYREETDVQYDTVTILPDAVAVKVEPVV